MYMIKGSAGSGRSRMMAKEIKESLDKEHRVVIISEENLTVYVPDLVVTAPVVYETCPSPTVYAVLSILSNALDMYPKPVGGVFIDVPIKWNTDSLNLMLAFEYFSGITVYISTQTPRDKGERVPAAMVKMKYGNPSVETSTN